MLRVWFADAAGTAELGASLRTAAAHSRASLDHVVAVFACYLEEEGAFPERAHLNAMVGELVADLFAFIEARCAGLAREIEHRRHRPGPLAPDPQLLLARGAIAGAR